MSEQIRASTKYGDLTGTVELDGHTIHPLEALSSLAKVPTGFSPVGLEMGLPDWVDQVMPYSILAYDSNKVGLTPEDMLDFAEQNGELPVSRFSGSMPLSMLNCFFKDWSLLAVLKSASSIADKMRVHSQDE